MQHLLERFIVYSVDEKTQGEGAAKNVEYQRKG